MPKKLAAKDLLIAQNLVEDEKTARALIMAGRVYTENRQLKSAGEQLSIDTKLQVKHKKTHNYVSRAALKLKHALEYQSFNITDKICMDLGSSTGGFTEILLEAGAKKIYAVDVGYNELAYKLRNNSKIIVLERTNARFVPAEQIIEQIDILTCDLSFTSCVPAVKANLKFLKPAAKLIILVKPQFELAKDLIGSGGIVAEDELHLLAIKQVKEQLVNLPLQELFLIASPIKGSKGNKEFLLAYQYEP